MFGRSESYTYHVDVPDVVATMRSGSPQRLIRSRSRRRSIRPMSPVARRQPRSRAWATRRRSNGSLVPVKSSAVSNQAAEGGSSVGVVICLSTRLVLGGLCFFCWSLAVPAGTTPPAPNVSTQLNRVTGLVHGAAPTENVVVAGARVEVVGGELDRQVFSTRSNGTFELPPVGSLPLVLEIKKDGFETSRISVKDLASDTRWDILIRSAVPLRGGFLYVVTFGGDKDLCGPWSVDLGHPN